ncbi:hypothetical protein E2C01_080939 [Portunus trituberculatus]|uniref:Uncharacterized protein n=1 Tax=Portunus trituberculatus TaxID=210409 RepID=A0A5B7IUX9_PORTR|nr:hypothetical protein [Portunus trituberculatus]
MGGSETQDGLREQVSPNSTPSAGPAQDRGESPDLLNFRALCHAPRRSSRAGSLARAVGGVARISSTDTSHTEQAVEACLSETRGEQWLCPSDDHLMKS